MCPLGAGASKTSHVPRLSLPPVRPRRWPLSWLRDGLGPGITAWRRVAQPETPTLDSDVGAKTSVALSLHIMGSMHKYVETTQDTSTQEMFKKSW